MNFNALNKLAIQMAILWAFVVAVFVVIAFYGGKNPYGPFTVIQCLSLAFFMFLTGIYIRAFRGEMEFGFQKAILYSLIIGVGSSLINLILGFIFLNITWETSFPIYYENMISYYQAVEGSGEMERVGEVDKEKFQQILESLKNAKPWNIVFTDFSLKIVTSLILSFIIAVVLRKSTINN